MDFYIFLRSYLARCPPQLVKPVCSILLDPIMDTGDYEQIKYKLLHPALYNKQLSDNYFYIINVYEMSLYPPPKLTREMTDVKNDHF